MRHSNLLLKNIRWIALGIVVVMIVWVWRTYHHEQISVFTSTNSSMMVRIHDRDLVLRVAQSPNAWSKGLGGVTDLNDQSGMIFIFPQAASRMFWNKGMLIGFDLLWIRNRTIIGIEHAIPPEREGIKTMNAPGPTDIVIELPYGWVHRYGVSVGEEVLFIHLP